MANLEDKETPNIIKPKRNKRYSKRVVITLAAVGTLVMLVKRGDEIIIPNGQLELRAGDKLLFISENKK